MPAAQSDCTTDSCATKCADGQYCCQHGMKTSCDDNLIGLEFYPGCRLPSANICLQSATPTPTPTATGTPTPTPTVNLERNPNADINLERYANADRASNTVTHSHALHFRKRPGRDYRHQRRHGHALCRR